MTLIVGLTGNMGSGKTTIARIFSILGVPIYYADKEAKKILQHKVVIDKLVNRFGKEILINNIINRDYLASKVFNDPRDLGFLNTLIHPLVYQDFVQWTLKYVNEPYIIHEAAVIFENNLEDKFDKIIMVSSPKDLLITRVMQRDNIEKSKVIKRHKNQMNQEEKMKLSDFNILNNEKESILNQVINIHRKLMTT